LENKRAEPVLIGGVDTSGWERRWGRVWEGEYSTKTVNMCM
jgi:hypothetical protein